jgi:outer membrane protein assembly factor BamB
VGDGHTFVAGCDSMLHVVDLKTGKEARSVDLEGQSAATPAVVGDQLYVGTMTNQFKAINWKKGDVLWTYESEERAQPFFGSAAAAGDLVIAGSRDKFVYAFDRKTGKPKWSVPTGGRFDASPVVVGERVYAPALDGIVYVFELATGKQVQKLALDGPISGSPAVSGGRLLIGTQKGTLYCLGKK